MAIYGVGTKINEHQVRDQLIQRNIIGTGWSYGDAADLHELFRSIQTGDIVFLKSCSFSSDIRVYAIGLITDNQILSSYHDPLIEIGRRVRWYSLRHFRITRPPDTKFFVAAGSLEKDPALSNQQRRVVCDRPCWDQKGIYTLWAVELCLLCYLIMFIECNY